MQQIIVQALHQLMRKRFLRTMLAVAVVAALLITPAVRVFGGTTSGGSTGHAVTPLPPLSPVEALQLKGINIGNDQSSTPNLPYKAAQNAADLTYLKGRVGRVRIALAYGLDANDVRNLKQLAVAAKQQGFYVQFGITAGADPEVSTYYNQWLTNDIVETARWAQENHIDEFAIGNEEDWYCQVLGAFTTKTPTEIRAAIKNKAAEVRKVFSGSIVYADAEATLDDWIQEGIGGLDRIYFNVYDTSDNFQNIITKIADNFGSAHGGIAEWSAQHVYTEMVYNGMTAQEYAKEIMRRAAVVKASRLPAYIFTLRMDPNGNDWGFMLANGTKHPGFDEFLAAN